MTADELHALAVRTRDAARLAERHGTSAFGYRRAAREACERMGEMAEQLAEALRSREAVAQDRLSRHLADQRRIDGRDETIDTLTRERDEARAELRALVDVLETSTRTHQRVAAIQHARAVLEEWGTR